MAQDKSAAEVKAMIKAKGVNLTDLSANAGYSGAAVSIALKKRSPYVQQMIADFLGMPPQEIWPSRYDLNGSPIRMDPRGRRGINHPKDTDRQQTEDAA